MKYQTENIIEIIDNTEPDYLFVIKLANQSWQLANVVQHPSLSGNVSAQAVKNMIPKLRKRFEFRNGIEWGLVADYFLQGIEGYRNFKLNNDVEQS